MVVPPVDPRSMIDRERLWSVVLGNHVVTYFRSRRLALAFEARTSRRLSSAMMAANLMMIEAFTAWRYAWPMFQGSRALRSADERCRQVLPDAERMLSRAVADTYGPNAAFFKWGALVKCLQYLESVAGELADLFATRDHAVHRAQCLELARRCAMLRSELDQLGTDEDTATDHRSAP